MTEQATEPKMEKEMTDRKENPRNVDPFKYVDSWGPGDPWGSITRAVALMRRAMTAAGIAHEHMDDERLSRAVEETAPGIFILDNNSAREFVWFCYPYIEDWKRYECKRYAEKHPEEKLSAPENLDDLPYAWLAELQEWAADMDNYRCQAHQSEFSDRMRRRAAAGIPWDPILDPFGFHYCPPNRASPNFRSVTEGGTWFYVVWDGNVQAATEDPHEWVDSILSEARQVKRATLRKALWETHVPVMQHIPENEYRRLQEEWQKQAKAMGV